MRNLNIVKKVLIVLMILFIYFNINILCSHASNETLEGFNSESIAIARSSGGNQFDLGDLDNYKKDPNTNDAERLMDIAGKVLQIVNVVGIVASVVILAFIGLKYMMGSVEEKADYKKTMYPYIIGAFFLFTGTTIPNLIYQFMQNFND